MSRSALTGLTVLLSAAIAAADYPFHDLSLNEALKLADQQDKAVMIDFFATWCGPCKMMDATAFKDRSVIEWMEKYTIPIKIDVDRQQNIARRYKIDGMPTFVFLKPDGTELDRIQGAGPTEMFFKEAKEIVSDIDTLARAKAKLEAAGADDPLARMEYADRLTRMGKHEEAMAEYLWCFDNGWNDPEFKALRIPLVVMRLKILAGVDLPTELASASPRYAPARNGLIARRDVVRDRIVSGKPRYKPTLFSAFAGGPDFGPDVEEFVALNSALGETAETLRLYDELRQSNPKSGALEALRLHSFDALVEAKRYREVAEAFDIDTILKRKEWYVRPASYVSNHGAAGTQEGGSPSGGGSDSADGPMDFEERRATIIKIGQFYQVMLGLGRRDEAAKLAERALALDDSAITYNELAWSGYLTGVPIRENLYQAEKAFELSKGEDASIVDTYARILLKTGRKDNACEVVAEAARRLKDEYSLKTLQTCGSEMGCDAFR